MRRPRRVVWGGALTALVLTGCTAHADRQIPDSICGTRVAPSLSKPLLQPLGKVSEWTSSGFRQAGGWSWCVVFVGKDDAMHLRFAHHGGPMNPMEAASPDNSVTGLQNPRRIHLADDAVIGDDGAIATIRCKDKAGADHFTLAVRVTRGVQRRGDIEEFMRAYMPATVKTLHCLKR
jgi:hypothetical protein